MSDSVSRASVKVLNSQGYKFFTSSQAVEEAKSTLRKYKPHQDLSSLIVDVVKGLGVEIISSPISVPQIKPHDRHIAAAVADVDGVLVSEDIALIGQMNSAQMHARTLREIAIGLCIQMNRGRTYGALVQASALTGTSSSSAPQI